MTVVEYSSIAYIPIFACLFYNSVHVFKWQELSLKSIMFRFESFLRGCFTAFETLKTVVCMMGISKTHPFELDPLTTKWSFSFGL